MLVPRTIQDCDNNPAVHRWALFRVHLQPHPRPKVIFAVLPHFEQIHKIEILPNFLAVRYISNLFQIHESMMMIPHKTAIS